MKPNLFPNGGILVTLLKVWRIPHWLFYTDSSSLELQVTTWGEVSGYSYSQNEVV